MNEQIATITATRHELPLGRQYVTYAWHGPRTAPAWVDMVIDLNDLPWPLVVVDQQERFLTNERLVVRSDVGYGTNALWWKLRRAVQRVTERTYRRLILTAMIWGWADVPYGTIPSWRHLRWPR